MAAQKAVEELVSKGLLPGQGLMNNKLEGMRKEGSPISIRHRWRIWWKTTQPDGAKIQEMAQDTEQRYHYNIYYLAF
jgi:hypothetical protein